MPPSEDRLALIRKKTAAALPSTDGPHDTDLPDEAVAKIEPTRVSPNRQPQQETPQLSEYRNQAIHDPTLLLELARKLETRGNTQRSLLAWERLVDSVASDEARTTEAIVAIMRLRAALPKWNEDPAKAMAITLHIATGKSNAEKLAPVLEEISRELEQASSCILKVSSSVKAGHDVPENVGTAPIALWLSGSNARSPSTEVLIFTSRPDEVARDQVLKSLFKVIRSYLGRTASILIPLEPSVEADPLAVIQSRITRLGWLELGSRLNKTLE